MLAHTSDIRTRRLRGPRAARVFWLGALAVLADTAAPAPASAPDPSHCIVPTCLVVDPSGISAYDVRVRDELGSPLPGFAVLLDFGSVTGITLCLESDPHRERRVTATTDGSGFAHFHVRGGGITTSGSVRVYAEGVLIGFASPRSPDLDGNLQVDPRDAMLLDALPSNAPAGDYDCDGDADGADSLLLEARIWSKCIYPLSSFGDVHASTDYGSYELKFTYMGLDVGTVTPSLAAVGGARLFDLNAFVPYQRSFGYVDDEAVGDTLMLGNDELKAFLDRIAARPFLQDTTKVAIPAASLMVLRGSGATERCWEFMSPSTALTDTLFRLLGESVTSPDAKEIVDEFRGHMVGLCP